MTRTATISPCLHLIYTTVYSPFPHFFLDQMSIVLSRIRSVSDHFKVALISLLRSQGLLWLHFCLADPAFISPQCVYIEPFPPVSREINCPASLRLSINIKCLYFTYFLVLTYNVLRLVTILGVWTYSLSLPRYSATKYLGAGPFSYKIRIRRKRTIKLLFIDFLSLGFHLP